MNHQTTSPTAPDWLQPQACWPAGVRAVFTTRTGGVSQPPRDSLNLGSHVGDDPDRVTHNRAILTRTLGVRPVFLNQVHGCDVLKLTPDTPDGVTADACWADAPGVACTVLVADCLPVLLATGDGSSVAAVHAGWRGLVGRNGMGILESLCNQWPAAASAKQRRTLQVWLGPCIGPKAFEVGEDVRAAFLASDLLADACFVPLPQAGKYLANLSALARRRLAALGIEQVWGNDGTPDWCTVTQTSRFFSHRRDSVRLGSTGRMAAVIWRS